MPSKQIDAKMTEPQSNTDKEESKMSYYDYLKHAV